VLSLPREAPTLLQTLLQLLLLLLMHLTNHLNVAPTTARARIGIRVCVAEKLRRVFVVCSEAAVVSVRAQREVAV